MLENRWTRVILSGLFSYLLAALIYLHQALTGYPFDPTQIGGLHHETFIVFFWKLAQLLFGLKLT